MDNIKNIFVSMSGDDFSEGTKEKPLKTLKAAQIKCRELLKEKCSVNIYIGEGDYPETLTLNEKDSAAEEYKVTYMPYENEKVRMVGGKILDGFKKVTDPAVLDRIKPEVKDKVYEISFADFGVNEIDPLTPYMMCGFEIETNEVRLIKNGEMMVHASYPNDGEYIRVEEVISQADYTNGDRVSELSKTEPSKLKFGYEGVKNWKELDDVWVFGYPAFDWAYYFGKAHNINANEKTLELHQPLPFAIRKGQRIRFVNVLEELDRDNEFYIDRKAGKVYIISENPERDVYEIALSTDVLLSINGAKNIDIKNITFSLCRNSALTAENSRNINIVGCNFCSNIKNAVTLTNCYDCEIKDNHISNMGGAGIIAECGDCGNLKESGVKIVNNEIHDFAKIVETYQHAIKINGYGNYVAHNEIYNAMQSAIHFRGNCNIFEYNDAHDCLKKTADSGAVGCGRDWKSSRNIFRYNYFHDLPISTCGHTTKGIYLDDIMLGTEIYSNIFENVQSGVYSHGGMKATIKNNIFIDCKTYSVRIFTCGHVPCPGFVKDSLIEPTKKWIKENPKWAEKFAEAVETVNDPLCMFPMYNKVNGNIIFKSPDISVEFGAGYTTELNDNLVTEDESIFEDYKNKNFAIKNIDTIREKIPGFEAPEFEIIGLIKK